MHLSHRATLEAVFRDKVQQLEVPGVVSYDATYFMDIGERLLHTVTLSLCV